jgi:hypothetical protein
MIGVGETGTEGLDKILKSQNKLSDSWKLLEIGKQGLGDLKEIIMVGLQNFSSDQGTRIFE